MKKVPAARSVDRDTERHLLFAAAVDLLRRVAAQMPVLLVLDDLHWADRPSLLLFRHVLASATPMRLLVLATFRAAEVSAEDPLAQVLATLHRESAVARMNLRGLDDGELVALLAAAGYELADEGVAFRDALAAETDGNPFFVLEVLRHLAETGAISQSEDGRWCAPGELRAQGLPVSVREVIGQRVHRLGTEATRMLVAASVIGRDFDLQVLGSVAELDEDELLDELDAAVGAALITEPRGTPGRFSFAHTLIQRALYDELTAARRQRWHRRIAEALEALPDPDDHVAELAYHWSAATPPVAPDKVLGYALAAGDHAQQRLAPDEALRWYAQALELVDQLHTTARDHRRSEALLRLGIAQRLAGRPEFRQTLLDAAGLARRLGDTDQLVQAALANTRGYAARFGGLDEQRIEVLRAALDAIGVSSPTLRARLLAQWAQESIYSPAYDTQALLDEALSLTEGTDDPQARWHALNALYWYPQSSFDELRARQPEYLGLTPRLDPAQQFLTYFGCFGVAISSGHLQEARELFEDLDQVAQTVGEPFMRWAAAWLRAGVALLDGDAPSGERHADVALQIALDSGQPDALMVYASLLAMARQLEGREAEICDLIAQTAADNPGLPTYQANLRARTRRMRPSRRGPSDPRRADTRHRHPPCRRPLLGHLIADLRGDGRTDPTLPRSPCDHPAPRPAGPPMGMEWLRDSRPVRPRARHRPHRDRRLRPGRNGLRARTRQDQ